MSKIVDKIWDYTQHAQFYSYRPNYAPITVDMLVELNVKNYGNGGGDYGS